MNLPDGDLLRRATEVGERLLTQDNRSCAAPMFLVQERVDGQWCYVTACFTQGGCEDYIRINGHNHGEVRIYADGSFRNEEYQIVRQFLMELAKLKGQQ